MSTNVFRGFVAAVMLCVALTGCTDKSNPDTIDQRAVERWNFLIAHQAEKAYDYLSPGYRVTQTRENYAAAMNNRAVQWNATKFKNKKCEAERCMVNVDVTYTVPIGGGVKPTATTSTRSETWILVDGAWFFLPRE